MSGLVRTVDKVEEMQFHSTEKVLPESVNFGPGKWQRMYGKRRGVDVEGKGYSRAKTDQRRDQAQKERDDALEAERIRNTPTPMPGTDEGLERAAQRRRYASRRQQGGRTSTILSDSSASNDTLG